MVGEVFAGLGALKTALDIAKGIKDIDDATRRNAAVIGLQEKILAAREAQSALLERVDELKKEVASFEKWDREKQRYELKNVGWGAFAYMLKKEERGIRPPHWVCTNCFEHKHVVTLQLIMETRQGQEWTCPSCKNTIEPGKAAVSWPD